VGQVDVALARLAGQLDAGRRVAGQQMVGNRIGQDAGEDLVGADHHSRPDRISPVHLALLGVNGGVTHI
jgi:hypothetical protein